MSMTTESHYNNLYTQANSFQYNERLYSGYIKALISKFNLKQGSTILDAPCGQGFFSYLFSKEGMRVSGTDISEVGIEQAKKSYAMHSIHFFAADIRALNMHQQFDCVYTRSCSLYNDPNYPSNTELTQQLLKLVKPGGLFIFAYNTNLRRKKDGPGTWVNHTFSDVKEHFESCRQYAPRFYVINKIDTFLFREWALNPAFTRINKSLLPMLKRYGDVLCVFRKPAE